MEKPKINLKFNSYAIIISLFLVITVIMLQQEAYIHLDEKCYFIIKFCLVLNYAFWSFVFIFKLMKDIIQILNDIKDINKKLKK